jgi:hypothetical protein
METNFPVQDLWKRLDSQGFVPLMFVTAFKRMRELTPEMPLAGLETGSARHGNV